MRESRWHRIKRTYERGMHVEGVVRRRLSGGCIVGLDAKGEAVGFLREREIQAAIQDGHIRDDSEFQDGMFITAAVQDYDDKRYQLDLGLRAIYAEQAQRQYESRKIGEIIEGTVTSHTAGGVFVSIDDKGCAYLPLGAIPLPITMHRELSETVLHVGDRIRAVITAKPASRRRYQLSITELGRRGAKTTNSGMCSSAAIADVSAATAEASIEAMVPQICKSPSPRKILVVENDELTRQVFDSYLSPAGHHLTMSATLQEMQNTVGEQPFDCILADITMDGGQRSTEHVLFRCREDGLPKAIFVTGEYQRQDLDLIQKQRKKVLDALHKPVQCEHLRHLLDTLQQPPSFQCEQSGIPRDQFGWRGSPSTDEVAAVKDTIERVSGHFRDSGVCILRRQKGAREFDVVVTRGMGESGLGLLLSEMKYDLKHTPFGDVVFEGRPFLATGLDMEHPGRFRSLFETRACQFGSFLGEPSFVYDEPELGVFVIGNSGGSVTGEDQAFLQEECRRLTTHLEAAKTLSVLAHHHSRLAAGDLLIHEIGGQMQNLEAVCLAIAELQAGHMDNAIIHLRTVRQAYEILKDTISFFREISHHAKARTRGIYATLKEVVEFLKPRFERGKIALELEADPKLDQHSFPEASVRQILINLVVNAYIQVGLAERCDGRVRIEAEVETREEKSAVVIHIIDNANGIHADDVERIFDPYVTTRRDGTGLGLYICRRLAKSLGGEVGVKNTWLYQGSTFEVRLPVSLEQRGANRHEA